MSQALYEEYKEALRRGHVAALRGRLDVAEAAYRAAAAIAPDRALPDVSPGAVLRRAERIDDALASFGVALSLAPEDEGALRGRAELQAERGRRAEAALDFETLAGVLERAGRLTHARGAAPPGRTGGFRGRRRGIRADRRARARRRGAAGARARGPGPTTGAGRPAGRCGRPARQRWTPARGRSANCA